MLEPVKSLDDLVNYLSKLETRMAALEAENGKLRTLALDNSRQDRQEFSRYVSQVLPQTNILSRSFFKRAFAVWGHFFVANFLIGLVFFVIYACVMGAFLGSTLGGLVTNGSK